MEVSVFSLANGLIITKISFMPSIGDYLVYDGIVYIVKNRTHNIDKGVKAVFVELYLQ